MDISFNEAYKMDLTIYVTQRIINDNNCLNDKCGPKDYNFVFQRRWKLVLGSRTLNRLIM